jgi:hypothetical protein
MSPVGGGGADKDGPQPMDEGNGPAAATAASSVQGLGVPAATGGAAAAATGGAAAAGGGVQPAIYLYPLPPEYERALHRKLAMTSDMRQRFRQVMNLLACLLLLHGGVLIL